jgi:hypothetical protein
MRRNCFLSDGSDYNSNVANYIIYLAKCTNLEFY